MAEDGVDVRIRCTDCSFEKTVSAEEDETAAMVLIEHGQRTGHKLTIDRIENGGE